MSTIAVGLAQLLAKCSAGPDGIDTYKIPDPVPELHLHPYPVLEAPFMKPPKGLKRFIVRYQNGRAAEIEAKNFLQAAWDSVRKNRKIPIKSLEEVA